MPNVLSCTEMFGSRSASMSVSGATSTIELTRAFKIILDSGGEGAEVAALTAPGLPVARQPHPYFFPARLKSLQLQPEGNDHKIWIADAAYGTDTESQEERPDNPLDEPPELEWGFQQFQRVADKDNNGKPIINKANEQFDPLPEIDDSRLVLTYSRNEPTFPVSLAIQYRDAVNSDTWNGVPEGKVKCQNIGARRMHRATEGGTFYYWNVNYEFHFRPDDWDLHILNQGYRLNTDGTYSSATDEEGRALNQPVLLDIDGQELTTGATPIFLDFEVYRKLPFAGFNISF